jgi:di/tricarboxylate transporter
VQEIVVLPGSSLIGGSLRDARFADRHEAIVLAIHRPGVDLADRPEDVPIHAGDVLVVEGGLEAMKRLAGTRGFLMVGAPAYAEARPGKVGIAVLTLAGVVLVAALGWMPIVTAATAGCIVLIVTRCLEPREAHRAIDLGIVFLLAGAIALGAALDKTGIARQIGAALAGLTPVTGPHVLLACFFLAAMLLSELMSNSGTVLLLAPIAVTSAQQAGVNPLALLAAVTFGASAAFVMPIGYQTSLMIYGPGGYRFRDFVRMGLPLDLILLAIALWLIPLYWPLQPR